MERGANVYHDISVSILGLLRKGVVSVLYIAFFDTQICSVLSSFSGAAHAWLTACQWIVTARRSSFGSLVFVPAKSDQDSKHRYVKARKRFCSSCPISWQLDSTFPWRQAKTYYLPGYGIGVRRMLPTLAVYRYWQVEISTLGFVIR